MKKRWTLIGMAILLAGAALLWIGWRQDSSCSTYAAKELPFFQIFSTPTADAQAREKKFISLSQQTYSLFRVAITAEEASYPDVQVWIDKFPNRFVKLCDGSGPQELFYRWIHSIPSKDIIVLFPATESLDITALSRLKELYEGSSAWLAFQGDIKKWAQNGVLTGYATLFQKIKLQDFLEMGAFSENCKPENRLFELAGRHVRRLRGHFIEGKSYGYSWIARSRKPYPRYNPGKVDPTARLDLVVLSYNKPLQLHAFLESVHQFVSSVDHISVIYRVSSPAYEKGYELVMKRFPHVKYLKQGDFPEKDFKPLLLQAAFESPNAYVAFAVDNMVVRDFIDVQEGIDDMEKTGAVGIFYHLGRDLEDLPSISVHEKAFAWQFSVGKGEWKHPYNTDLTLYRKKDIKGFLTSLKFIHPRSLDSLWNLKAKLSGVGIYYDTSKVVHIPTERLSERYTSEELLTIFLSGLKLDIKPLEHYHVHASQLDALINFVPQDETRH